MNILLVNYSYFPYNFGGTEIYVSGLVKYLDSCGHQVTIISGVPEKAFIDNGVYFEDKHIKSVIYKFDGVTVLGVLIKNTSTVEIYRKSRPEAVKSWVTLLNYLPIQNWDILHFHAHTSAFGINVIEAVKIKSQLVKIIVSYHLPLSCVKNNLMYKNQLQECVIRPTATICSACYLSERKSIPFQIAKSIVKILSRFRSKYLPFIFRLKYLVKQSIDAFKEFDNEVDSWYVFSNQIKQTLILNQVEEKKILLLSHGVSKVFEKNNLFDLRTQSKSTNIVFLYVGRFEKIKGFYTLLKSWIELKETNNRKLEIIGTNQSDDVEINNIIKKAKCRNDIVWHGKKSQDEIATIMLSAHCTIIPSECVEIGPLVFHEAISCGTDVIASDIGGCKELVKYYAAKSLSFKTGSTKSLQERILNFSYSNKLLKVNTQIANYSQVEIHYQKLGFNSV